MPPYSGPPNPRRWTSPLQVDGRPVFDDDGYTLSKYGFEVLLGWVKQGNLTDLGMQAVKTPECDSRSRVAGAIDSCAQWDTAELCM